MEEIKDFAAELNTLLDTRSRVSVTKIQAIGRLGVQHIRNYKHVVHAVEKMIAKCPPECKLAGLYVIDAIVRRSRSKFGAKDVFAPRFAKNMATTIEAVLRCPPSDRERVRKVVDGWSHARVFDDGALRLIETLGSGYLPEPRSPGYYEAKKRERVAGASVPATPVAPEAAMKSLVDDFDYGDDDGGGSPPLSVSSTPAQSSAPGLAPAQAAPGAAANPLALLNALAMNPAALQSQIQHLQALLTAATGTAAAPQVLPGQPAYGAPPAQGGYPPAAPYAGYPTQAPPPGQAPSQPHGAAPQPYAAPSYGGPPAPNAPYAQQPPNAYTAQPAYGTGQSGPGAPPGGPPSSQPAPYAPPQQGHAGAYGQGPSYGQHGQPHANAPYGQAPPQSQQPPYGAPPQSQPGQAPPQQPYGQGPPSGAPQYGQGPATQGAPQPYGQGPPPSQQPYGAQPQQYQGPPHQGPPHQGPPHQGYPPQQHFDGPQGYGQPPQGGNDGYGYGNRGPGGHAPPHDAPYEEREGRFGGRDQRDFGGKEQPWRNGGRDDERRPRDDRPPRDNRGFENPTTEVRVPPNAVLVRSCTLWLGNLPASTTKEALHAQLSRHGPIADITLKPERSCAFVQFANRPSAESAKHGRYDIDGTALKVHWSRNYPFRTSKFDWSWFNGEGAVPISMVDRAKVPDVREGMVVDEVCLLHDEYKPRAGGRAGDWGDGGGDGGGGGGAGRYSEGGSNGSSGHGPDRARFDRDPRRKPYDR